MNIFLKKILLGEAATIGTRVRGGCGCGGCLEIQGISHFLGMP